MEQKITERDVIRGRIQVATMLFLITLILLLVAYMLGLPNWANFRQSLQVSWSVVGLGLVLTPVCIFLAHGIKLLQLMYVGMDKELDQPEPELSNSTHWFVAFSSGLPEEILFRGVLLPILGIWGSSLVFAVMHVDERKDLPYGLYTFVYGLIFGLMYQWTGNLWVPIIVHVLNNYFAGNPPQWWTDQVMRVYLRVLGEQVGDK